MKPIKAPAGAGNYSLTAPVPMTFPQLFEPKAIGPKGRESGKPKYSAGFLFEKSNPDLKALMDLAKKIANMAWPNRSIQELKFPFANGDKLVDARAADGKNDNEFNRGKIVLSARSIHEPKLSLIEHGRVTDLEGEARLLAKPKFYFGVYTLCTFNLVAYEGVGANPDGVTAYLDLIASLNKGEKLGATRASAAHAFSGYIGKHSAEDPTAGHVSVASEDEIPF